MIEKEKANKKLSTIFSKFHAKYYKCIIKNAVISFLKVWNLSHELKQFFFNSQSIVQNNETKIRIVSNYIMTQETII